MERTFSVRTMAAKFECDAINEAGSKASTSGTVKKELRGDKLEVHFSKNATVEDSVIIGIDLGTTYCCVAYSENGKVTIIPNEHGDNTTPSYVALTEESNFIVGKRAKEEVFEIPENVVFDSKRLLGRPYNDTHIQNDIKHWPFTLRNFKNRPLIELILNDKPVPYKPIEISATILTHLKAQAENYLKKKITGCVITVPAHFNYFQRTATRDAATLAGLNRLGFINEPTAAALAYMHENKVPDNAKLLVFDFGGGTLDVSIVKIVKGTVVVLATAGNTHLGGRDFDNNLAKIIIEKLGNQSSINNEVTQRRVDKCCEDLKIQLSTAMNVTFDLPYLIDTKITIHRQDFEKINMDLFSSAIDLVANVLEDAKLKTSDIQEIVLVGGSTKIPKIREMLSNFFNGKRLDTRINPDEAIAYGAAIHRIEYTTGNKSEVTVRDVTPLSLGVGIHGDVVSVVIPRNSSLPVTKTNHHCTIANNQALVEANIYEGERPLCSQNIFIGTVTLKLPPKPIGYAVAVTFKVGGDGILQVSITDESGLHKSLFIEHQVQDDQSIEDMLHEFKLNQPSDNKKREAANAWADLESNCYKLTALCEYDLKNMSYHEKAVIQEAVKDTLFWTSENKVVDDTDGLSKLAEIRSQENSIKLICSPIILKYAYPNPFTMSDKDFYKFIISIKT